MLSLSLLFIVFWRTKNFLCEKKTENCNKYFEIDINNCICFEIFKLFFLIDKIILTVNFSLKKWNAIFSQINFEINKWYFFRYESKLWIESKSRYNAIKQKYCNLLKTLKKIRFWLYKMQFIIEIDANILMTQLNRSAANFSKVLIIH